MAVDLPKWLLKASSASELVLKALQENMELFDKGLSLSSFPEDGEEEYPSAQLFFKRVQLEISTANHILRSVTVELLESNGPNAQVVFDDVLKRQRKMFESLLLAIMLSRNEIWETKEATLYFLHLHLIHDLEHYRRVNGDMEHSFGFRNSYMDECITSLENRLQSISVKADLCSWSNGTKPNDANSMYLNIRKDATDLERSALGLSYSRLYGISSGQIHFNLSRFHSNEVNQNDLLEAIEHIVLMSVCLLLRQTDILEKLGKKVSPSSETLRTRFSGVLPNNFAKAVLGEAEIDDLVSVFRREGTGNFIGFVLEKLDKSSKKDNFHKYASYRIKRIPGGRKDWFPATSVMLMEKSKNIPKLLEEAEEKEFISSDQRSERDVAFSVILANQTAVNSLINPIKAHLPTLYFVQEYLAEKTKTVSAMPDTPSRQGRVTTPEPL